MSNLNVNAESVTRGLVREKLASLPLYPQNQNIITNGIIWFEEDSYKSNSSYNWLAKAFSKASKKQTLHNEGRPDFIIVKNNLNIVIIIECKPEIKNHSRFEDVKDYIYNGYGNPHETQSYAIDGALFYSSFLTQKYNVIAIGVSGQSQFDLTATSFLLPQEKEMNDIIFLDSGNYENVIKSINTYNMDLIEKFNYLKHNERDIIKELRKYTFACANFLRANGIEDNSKAGFVSAIILGLTNKESELFIQTKHAIDEKNKSKSLLMFNDYLGKRAQIYLRDSLYGVKDTSGDIILKGVWDIDEIPSGKRKSLKRFYDILLNKKELKYSPKERKDYFKYGDTFLSACIYSLYENVFLAYKKYSGVDIMGEFYTMFLRFTKGNAKEKGIVLTPKHITNLFCDIGEYFIGHKFTKHTKILDTCCGTGAFLISALNRIRENIEKDDTLTKDEKNKNFEFAQKNSLIGIESDESMYALSYANMRFHGDGKSNLFNCSSLTKDSYFPEDDRGKTYYKSENQLYLVDILKNFGDIDIGMINPPYSIGNPILNISHDNFMCEITDERKSEVSFQNGQSELDFVASMLHYLKIGGIGIAIVPMSCAGNSGERMRKKILNNHTLLACMTMPNQLFFDSHVGTCTCIMVFKAHIKHDESRSVFFGRWIDDGFHVIPHNGRKDSGNWLNIKKEWLNEIDNISPPNNCIFMRKKISINDEALAEAYVKTDYSKLHDKNFIKNLKIYSLFKYSESCGLEGDKLTLTWYLENIDEGKFNEEYSMPYFNLKVNLYDREWKYFCLGDQNYFEVERGSSSYLKNMGLGDIPYISTTQENNGIASYVDEFNRNGNFITLAYDGSIGACFYQEHQFFASEKIVTIQTKQHLLNKYIAFFIITILKLEAEMYSYGGRKWTVEKQLKSTMLNLPVNNNGEPDYEFMENYIKSLPYSKLI